MNDHKGFESFIGDESQAEVSQEQVAEYAAQVQRQKQQQQQDQQQEAQQDEYEDAVSAYLQGLMQNTQGQHSPLLLMVARLLARDVPSLFLLSVLSVYDQGARSVFSQGDAPSTTGPSASQGPQLSTQTPQQQMQQWTQRMTSVAFASPRKLLEKGTEVGTTPPAPLPELEELAILCLQQYLMQQERDLPPRQNLEVFVTGFFQGLWKELIRKGQAPEALEKNT